MITSSACEKLARLLVSVITGVVVIVLIHWARTDPIVTLSTDWTAFDNAGSRLVSGEAVYRPWSAEAEPYPYLYPPFALWLALPLAGVGFWGAFALSAVLPFAAFVAGLGMLSRAKTSARGWATPLTIAVASGAIVGATLVGQYSGLYVFAFGAGTLLFTRARYGWAGVALALLWLKPNIAIVVPIALTWGRSWRALGGFAAGSAGMVMLSLPFGLEQWRGFYDNVQAMAELQEQGLVPVDKMITLLAAIQRILDLEQQTQASISIWLVLSAVLGTSVLSLWSSESLHESPVRAFGALAMFAVAANPRLYFYDGTLAMFGMVGLWMHAALRGGMLAQRGIPLLTGTLWVGTWGAIWSPLNAIVGVAAACALVVTAVDAGRTRAVRQTIAGSIDEPVETVEISTTAQAA